MGIVTGNYDTDKFVGNAKALALYGIGGLVALILLAGIFFTIPAGYCGVLTTFGAASQSVLGPGLHFKLPIVQGVVRMNVQVQKNQLTEHAASLDLQDVETTVVPTGTSMTAMPHGFTRRSAWKRRSTTGSFSPWSPTRSRQWSLTTMQRN